MTRGIPVRLVVAWLCSLAAFPLVVAAAADENHPGLSFDAGSRASGGGQWTIVATYSIPEGASGLAYDGTFLYCGIYGSNGNEIYQIDPDTGLYTLLFTGPQEDAFGLTYDGQYLWTTDHPGSPSTPAIAIQMDWSGAVLTQFDLPAHYMSGIAYENGDFWVAAYYPDPSTLYKVNTGGSILAEFTAPDNQPWDLCIENGNLWMADYWGDALYKIDATSGALLETHPSAGVDPAGIAWDGQFLWYCDNGEGFDQDFLYKVDLQGDGAPEIIIPVASHDYGPVPIGDSITWNLTVQNTGGANLSITSLTFVPPNDLSSSDSFPINIPASGETQISIVYSPDDFAPLAATAIVLSNDPIHPEEYLTLTGHGVYPGPSIMIVQDVHDFGSIRLDATTRWYADIRNEGSETLTIDDVVIDDPNFYLDEFLSLPISIAPLAYGQIGVWFNPDAETSYNATVAIYSNDLAYNPAAVSASGTGWCAAYDAGDALWSYVINTSSDNTPKAIASIPDVSGDGVADVIVCSEDAFIRCFNGNADGTGDVLWEHEIPGGSIYSTRALQITEDIDGDGYNDLVVGAAWAADLIRALSGKTGQTIWTHDTHEYGNGGWVYQVDSRYDYNGDDVLDVLAVAGNDSTNTGPKRAYCLDGVTGVSIWETPLNGPGFSVISVDDFTGDGRPDAVAGASSVDEAEGRVFGIDGTDGSVVWSFVVGGSSVWALQQMSDITADGVRDIIAGDFSGNVYGLDATDGSVIYTAGGFGTLIHLERVDDVNGDGHPDIIPGHYGTTARMISGATGTTLWSTLLADKPSVVAAIDDVTGDGINDVVVGTLFNNNFVYWLDGVDGSVVQSVDYGTPLDSIAAIPDVVGDGLWEVMAGGRNGLLTCFSGTDVVDPCGAFPPLPEESLGITTCTLDADCTNEAYCVPDETGGFPGTCYVPKNRYLSLAPNSGNTAATARRLSVIAFERSCGGAGNTACISNAECEGNPNGNTCEDVRTGSQVIGWFGQPDADGFADVVIEASRHYTIWANLTFPMECGVDELCPAGSHCDTGLGASNTCLLDADDTEVPSTVVQLSGCHIAPKRRDSRPGLDENTAANFYLIEAIAQGSDIADASNYSTPLELRTVAVWGDMTGGTSGNVALPPDGSPGFLDILHQVKRFKGKGKATTAWLDLEPDVPDRGVGFLDMLQGVNGFKNQPYPFVDPCECAGLPPCN